MAGEPVTSDAVSDAWASGAPPPAVSGPLTPARPFPAGGSPLDRARAQQCLTTAIYYEAASEPTDGKRAVAQVVLNRVLHPAFPSSVCGVVYQGSERWTGCQFSFTCDGSLARVPARREWGESAAVAAQALAGRVFAPVGLATHYHTWRVWPAWGRTLVSTTTVGAHIFTDCAAIGARRSHSARAMSAASRCRDRTAASDRHPRAWSPRTERLRS